ncbi:hypothetical protein R1sor_005235 [Riccia sorocarpa]|uniref:FYVE-type domain-containing protein n=1 Tax=Riccia sorocarpa TaxID=122646 RepID=A0ABD3HMP2_9MARC
MQGGYGGGVYPAPPIPPDYSALYGGTPAYGGGSAPSAPAYAPAAPPGAPSYHQAIPSNNSSSPAAGAYSSQFGSEFSQSFNSPSNSFVPTDSLNQPSYNSSYPPPPSYAPVVPSYPSVAPAYDRSSEFGVGTAPSSTSFDSYSSAQRSNYGNASFGAPPQAVAPTGYDSYGGNQGGYSQSGEGESGRFDMYGNIITGIGRSDSVYSSKGGGNDRSYDNGGFQEVTRYDGGGEPYGSRGTGGSAWSSGGSGSFSAYGYLDDTPGAKSTNVARAAPKSDDNTDTGGIQKFRVKLLPELRSSESTKDVVCQIGLDGLRIVDPSGRTLRIYPLDTITRWEVKEPSVFTFWAKSSVDIDQRMIQLQSSSYVTTQILDTLTAACVQRFEMKDEPADAGTSGGVSGAADLNATKKTSVLDWVAIRPRASNPEEKQHWVPDEAVTKCNSCDTEFGAFLRRHHCRNCGDIFCDKCTRGRIALNTDEDSQPVRVCDRCLAEITQRLDNPKPTAVKPSNLRTHEDLAKKLQEELERNSGRKQNAGRTSSSHAPGSSNSTSVINCSKCGSVAVVTGSNTRCSNCDTSSRSSAPDRRSGGVGGSTAPQGPPHLWPSSAPSDGPGPRMREVACPTCTVHLQVQVPAFGTETVECGVCQHPFLVAA